MKCHSMLFSLLLIASSLFSCQKTEFDITYLNSAEVQKRVAEDGITINYVDSVALNDAIYASVSSFNRKKNVGVFGGSLSSRPESLYAKYLWAYYLDWDIFTYGYGGYGFSSLQGSIQDEVDHAKKHDIYILWASTNDYTSSREIGSVTDYTEADGFNPKKLETQCGGLNYCIKKIRSMMPNAKIYIFGSLPFYLYAGGYSKEAEDKNELGYTFYQYVEAQKAVAEAQNVMYFNQFDIPVITKQNSDSFYYDDKFHMTEQGYANIGVYQLYFLSTETELK